jgi:hypothetical protein
MEIPGRYMFNIKDCVIIIVIYNFKNHVFLWTYYLFISFHEENMDLYHIVNESNIRSKDIYLAYNATMQTIPRYKQYFSNMRIMKEKWLQYQVQ